MKRPSAFTALFWLPLIPGILLFWSRHWNTEPVPFWTRFLQISPSSLTILVATILIAAGWCAYLWLTREKEHHLRPLTVFFWWLVLAVIMGCLAMGDVWHFTDVPLPDAEKIQIMLREFNLTDPLLVNGLSMFGALVGHIFHGLSALVILMLAAVGVGTWCRKLFARTEVGESASLFLQAGMGLVAWIIFLGFMGLAGVLGASIAGMPLLAWLLGIAALIGVVREGKRILHVLWRPVLLDWRPGDGFLQPFFVVGLMLVTAASFLHILRPIPIGWDDIGVYMNVASLTGDHGTLVGGFGTYNWGLIMSLGFLVWHTPYVAMLFSFLGGLLAFWGITLVLRQIFADKKPGAVPLFLLTALAMSPFVLFQMGEDMKIDMGLLFLGSLSFFITLLLWRREDLRRWPFYLVLGLILGVALGVKMTAILLIIMVVSLLGLRLVGGWALAAILFWSLFAFFLGDFFALGGLHIMPDTRQTFLIITGILGIGATIKVLLASAPRRAFLTMVIPVIVGILLAFSPWLIFNLHSWCATSCSPVTMNMLIYSNSAQPALPAETQLAAGMGTTLATASLQQTLQSEGGTVTEELGRYAGFDTSPVHYLSLPFDISFSQNVAGDYVTVGWVFMGLLLLAAAWGLTQYDQTRKSWVVYGLAYFILAVVILGTFSKDTALFGFLAKDLKTEDLWIVHTLTVGVGAAILFAIAYLSSQYHAPASVSSWMRGMLSHHKEGGLRDAPLGVHIGLVTVLYGFLWIYLASGVVWYGIIGVLGILCLGALALQGLRDSEEGHKHYIAFLLFLTVFWILPMYAYKLTTSDTNIKNFSLEGNSVVSSFKEANSFDTRHFILFKAGVLDQDNALKFFNSEYYAAAALLNQESESKIYRIGTLLPYFVHSNDTRIATDNQLDQFIGTYLPRADNAYFLKRLYDAGYRYIVFDLGTDSIDKTDEKTLTKKVDIFQSFINGDKLGNAPREANGERLFTKTNPLLKEELRASGFIIWSIQPQ